MSTLRVDTIEDSAGTGPPDFPQGATAAGDGVVTAAAVIADHAIVRGVGGAKGVQSSAVTIDDNGTIITIDGTSATPSITQGGAYVGTMSIYRDGNAYVFKGANIGGIKLLLTDRTLTVDGPIVLSTVFPNIAKFSSTSQGLGSHLMWSKVNIVDTPITVVANGTGDVTLVLSGTFTVSDGAGNVAGGVITATAPSGTFDLYSDGGTNVCQLQVAADGSVVVVRTAGSRTYAVNLALNWM